MVVCFWWSFFVRTAENSGKDKKEAETALQQARDKLEPKRTACNAARERYRTAKQKTSECAAQHQQRVNERTQQEGVVASRANIVVQRKTQFERLNESLRNLNRERSQTETNFKTTTNKLQRTQTQLNTINNDLQKSQSELVGYERQKQEYESNIETVRTTIVRHERQIEEHRLIMNNNQIALVDITATHQKQIVDVQRMKGSMDQIKRSLGEKVNSQKSKAREMTQQQALLEAEKKTVQQLRDDLAANQTKLADVKQEMSVNMEKLMNVTGQMKDLQQEKTELEQRQKTTLQELNKCESAKWNAHRQVEVQKLKVQGLSQKLDTLNARDEKLSGEIKQVESKLNSKTEQVANNQNAINKVNENLRSVQEQQKKSRAILDASNTHFDSLNAKVREQTDKINQQEQAFRETNNRIRCAEDKFVGNEALRTKIYERSQRLEQSITELKQYHSDEQLNLQLKSNQLISQQLEENGIAQRMRNQNRITQPQTPLVQPKKKEHH